MTKNNVKNSCRFVLNTFADNVWRDVIEVKKRLTFLRQISTVH